MSDKIIQSPEARRDQLLSTIKNNLLLHSEQIGPRKIDLLFNPEGDQNDGWRTSKAEMSAPEGLLLRIERLAELGYIGRDSGIDRISRPHLTKYDSTIGFDKHIFTLKLDVSQVRNVMTMTLSTMGPAQYILNLADDARNKDFSAVNDPEFARLVPAGNLTEIIFSTFQNHPIGRMLIAYNHFTPSNIQEMPLSNGINMRVDGREFERYLDVEKIVRNIDGSLTRQRCWFDQTNDEYVDRPQ